LLFDSETHLTPEIDGLQVKPGTFSRWVREKVQSLTRTP
jgi:hypothetical protein